MSEPGILSQTFKVRIALRPECVDRSKHRQRLFQILQRLVGVAFQRIQTSHVILRERILAAPSCPLFVFLDRVLEVFFRLLSIAFSQISSAELLFKLIRSDYKGSVPRFAYDEKNRTSSNNGELMRDESGDLVMTEGYRVLIDIEDFSGSDVLASLL